MGGETGPGRPSKVARLIDEYDLEGLGAELEQAWTADGDARASLRELADRVNRRLLERSLRRAGGSAIGGEIDALYRALAGEEGGPAGRTRAKRRLEREGVDVDALEDAFVSHGAVRTYLRSERGVTYDGAADPVEAADEAIARLAGRLEAVAADKLVAASRTDDFALGEADVTVAVRVACRDCGRQADVATLLERGGCDCA